MWKAPPWSRAERQLRPRASSVSLLGQTVGQSLQAAADRWPHREAWSSCKDGVRKTFSQFQEDVDQAAAGLLALGLKRGDRLGVWGPTLPTGSCFSSHSQALASYWCQ
ncbi:medium-chain acyl-CoA ligase ACSF2, mitochondrial [Salvelinus sp. IW2-2015]|uniref:medium-chain acyl-CoA ligase ACSF2, mitochondrial n=1 Tax=Salvelinus sp. IW2-2015 TaxID=2691554 RepID=UPI000CEAE234|nr:acyl-CoA synthetase family member 2, mitochondrial-like [Salvelinus alpinus]XP_024000691.1 acyl-CoA synthetase family member 2, mitochondrial-like [Salvelinus alpinus]